jgi:hypothetical protein
MVMILNDDGDDDDSDDDPYILIFLQCIRTHDIRVDDLTKTE